jgi:hypothetical protein
MLSLRDYHLSCIKAEIIRVEYSTITKKKKMLRFLHKSLIPLYKILL